MTLTKNPIILAVPDVDVRNPEKGFSAMFTTWSPTSSPALAPENQTSPSSLNNQGFDRREHFDKSFSLSDVDYHY
jgi:hypothetical protein